MLSRVAGLNFRDIVRAREMDELELRRDLQQRGQRLEDEIVDAGRALASTHDEHDRMFRREPERDAARGGFARLKLRTHRRAGAENVLMPQPRTGGREADERLIDEVREPAVGLAGNGVRLVQEGRCATRATGEHRRRAGEAAHRENGLRGAFTEEALRGAIRFPEAGDEVEEYSRELLPV